MSLTTARMANIDTNTSAPIEVAATKTVASASDLSTWQDVIEETVSSGSLEIGNFTVDLAKATDGWLAQAAGGATIQVRVGIKTDSTNYRFSEPSTALATADSTDRYLLVDQMNICKSWKVQIKASADIAADVLFPYTYNKKIR